MVCAKRAGKAPTMLEALAATFFIHVFWAPADALSISFLLSYGGLLGIVLFSQAINAVLLRIPCFFCAESLAASIGASVATSPICAVFFGYVTPGGILASTVISPLASIFVITGIICTLATIAVPPLGFLAGTVMNLMYQAIVALVGWFALIPQLPV
jgi:competence protein ComEC